MKVAMAMVMKETRLEI